MAFPVVLVVFLAAYNNVVNLYPIGRWTYIAGNVAVGAALLLAARAAGYDWVMLGISRDALGPGVRWGGAVAAATAAGLGAALLVPAAEPFLDDSRVAGLSVSSLAFMAFVRIPIGTALFEEVAFRGVLFGTWAQRRSVPVALGVSSLVFGIWHVVPALEMLRVNRPGLAGAWLVLAVAGACAGTALGGVFLGCLRIRTQGLVAPVVVHASVNALATLAAWTSQHRL